MVCDGQGFLYVMVGDEDTDVFLFELRHNTLNIFHCNGVNSCKWFVKQDKVWVSSQRTGDFGTASLPTRKQIAAVLADVPQTEFINEFFHLVALLFLAHFGHLQDTQNVFFNA